MDLRRLSRWRLLRRLYDLAYHLRLYSVSTRYSVLQMVARQLSQIVRLYNVVLEN